MPTEHRSRLASVAIEDPADDSDTQGEAPSYTDILAARIAEMKGARLRLRVDFAGQVPASLPEDSVMQVEFTIERDGEKYALYAEGDESGWTPYLATKGHSREVEGAIEIRGNSVVFRVAREVLGGRLRFIWHADASWTHSGFTTTDFAFDSAPNDESARFPQQRD